MGLSELQETEAVPLRWFVNSFQGEKERWKVSNVGSDEKSSHGWWREGESKIVRGTQFDGPH